MSNDNTTPQYINFPSPPPTACLSPPPTAGTYSTESEVTDYQTHLLAKHREHRQSQLSTLSTYNNAHPNTNEAFLETSQHTCTPTSTTVITLAGISCKRTMELCPACPPALTLSKLAAIIKADRKECWIPAKEIDIATVGGGGKWLGDRFSILPRPEMLMPVPKGPGRWRRKMVGVSRNNEKRRPRLGEIDLEAARGSICTDSEVQRNQPENSEEMQRLTLVLGEMARELRVVELRLCRAKGEVHTYRAVAVVAVILVVLAAAACSWIKSGGVWVQSIAVNLVSSMVFGAVAWAFWRPRDE
ncbi:Protein of unknown function [Pyronema omphalodes CBS 100304]|uniref:Uncharacterized protein n=1 Tax=Pyronema omphalodes (strain CBS 100304) TaxID=1076935 RepID=U4LNR4_PYROM|nr:Protein of unknown function [Pyronema omphalodes CBS 100304]